MVHGLSSPPAGLSPARMGALIDRALHTLATEVPEPCALPVIDGALPRSLRGIVLRNGPGRQQRGGVRYGHPFDGDGFLQRFAFDGRSVTYRARFVRTREWLAEERHDRILYRGFGTHRPGGIRTNLLRMRFKNAANTSVVQHAGRTLALWEGGLPHAFDPDTLETIGRVDLGGLLTDGEPRRGWLDRRISPELPFSAHPSIDPRTGELFSFGTAYGRVPRLLVHRIDADGRASTRILELDGLPFVHDFALTERFLVFVLPAVRFDIPAALLGRKTPVGSLALEDGPGTALIVPRDGGPVRRVPVAPGFVFHWAAAWEEGDRIVLDGVKYDRFPALDDLSGVFGSQRASDLIARLTRTEIDLSTGQATERQLCPHGVELPQRRGEGPDRVIYATATPPSRDQPFHSGLLRVAPDQSTVHRDLGEALPSEPLIAGGFVVVQLRTPEGSELRILDPDTLEDVCRLAMPHPVPPPLHGIFLPTAA